MPLPEFNTTDQELIKALDNLSKFKITDLFMDDFSDQLKKIISQAATEQITSQGERSGDPYKPLNKGYASRKEAIYGQQPILVATGDLYSRVANGDEYAVNITNLDQDNIRVSIEITDPIAIEHQLGDPSTNLPARPIFVLIEDDADRVGDLVQNAIQQTLANLNLK